MKIERALSSSKSFIPFRSSSTSVTPLSKQMLQFSAKETQLFPKRSKCYVFQEYTPRCSLHSVSSANGRSIDRSIDRRSVFRLNGCAVSHRSISSSPSSRLQKNLMWNTVTVQYNPLIEEEFDEHFKVTCEYGYDFWKTVTFPFLDVE